MIAINTRQSNEKNLLFILFTLPELFLLMYFAAKSLQQSHEFIISISGRSLSLEYFIYVYVLEPISLYTKITQTGMD